MASTIVITYDGTDITSHVLFADATFESLMNAMPGTFEFRCKDPASTLNFVTGKIVTLTVDGALIFGGFVTQVGRTYAIPADHVPSQNYRNRIWQVRGVDYNILFDKRVIRNLSGLTQLIPDTAPMYDGAVIRTYYPTYFDWDFITFDAGHIADLTYYTAGYNFLTQGSKAREQTDNMAWQAGAIYYIGADAYFNYRSLDTVVKRWGFSDAPNNLPISATPATYQGVTIGPREIEATEDGSYIVNDAFVWGGSEWAGSGTVVVSHYQNSSSESTHGRWQLAETHFDELKIQDAVDARAHVIVDGPPGADENGIQRGLKYSQWQIKLGWFADDVPMDPVTGHRDHLKPGEITNFALYAFGSGGTPLTQVLPLRSLRVSFLNLDPTGKAYVRFDGFWGLQPDDPYTLWKFLLHHAFTATLPPSQAVVTNDSTAAIYGAFGQFTPLESPDSSRTAFTLPFGYLSNSTNVYVNGILQAKTTYTETDPAGGIITFTSAPATGVALFVTCLCFG